MRENLLEKPSRILEVSTTLLHFLGMRTSDIFTGEIMLKVRSVADRVGGTLRRGRERGTTAQVKLDGKKCLENPLLCAQCMKLCPEGVFFVHPRGRKPGEICETYELLTAFKSRCTGCGICVEACPRGALTLKQNLI